jgi:hypothetical protein
MSNEAGKPLEAEVPSLIITIIRTAAVHPAAADFLYMYYGKKKKVYSSILDDSIIVSFVAGVSIVYLPRR